MTGLLASYDAVLTDLDGVIYAGPTAIEHAVQSLARLPQEGIRLAFITNNASRSPAQVAAHLNDLGVAAEPEQVVSSPQAAARLMAARLDPGAKVLITGSAALAAEIKAAGLTPVHSAQDQPAAVVQGFDPELGWKDLAEAAYAIAAGAWWVATNTDMSIPQARGIAPGNGTLVAAVAAATGATAEVAGKPETPLFFAAAERLESQRPVVLGDRLDTDILGANRAGFASILVLTGVNTAKDALFAVPQERPSYIVPTTAELFEPYEQPVEHDGVWVAGSARAQLSENSGELRLEVSGDVDDVRSWHAACAAVWAAFPDQAISAGLEIAWV